MKCGAAVVVLLGAVTVGAQAPPRDLAPSKLRTATIRGRVLAAADGAPIRKARVSLSATSHDGDPVLTDDDGRFELGGLAAGHYTVTAAKAGYASTTFGARRFLDRSTPIVLASGGLAERIDIRMPRGAAITGRVVDDLGDPLIGINVTAGRVVRNANRLRLVHAVSTQTDDLGEYRLAGLSAGPYVVKASSSGPTSADGVIFTAPIVPGVSTPPDTYFPNTRSLAQAQPLSVKPGEEMPAIDFQLTPMRTPTLTIGVTDALGQPAAGTFNLVSTSSFEALNRSGLLQDGYAWTGISPGDWMLLVRGQQGVAVTPFTVDGDDVSLSLTLTRPGRLSGRVVFEGSTRALAARIRIEASPHDDYLSPLPMMRATMTMNRDDTFVMSGLIGARDFRLGNAPRGVRLKSLTLEGRSLLDRPMDFAGGEDWTGVVAVVTDEQPEVRGTVVDRDNVSVTDYSAIVFPDDRSRWSDPTRWLRWVRGNQQGAFAIDDLPPGRYLAAAVSDVDGVSWSDEAHLESLRSHATPFELGESGTMTLALQLVSAP